MANLFESHRSTLISDFDIRQSGLISSSLTPRLTSRHREPPRLFRLVDPLYRSCLSKVRVKLDRGSSVEDAGGSSNREHRRKEEPGLDTRASDENFYARYVSARVELIYLVHTEFLGDCKGVVPCILETAGTR